MIGNNMFTRTLVAAQATHREIGTAGLKDYSKR